jgi:hypothetical protein
MKTKNIKTILPNYSAIAIAENIQLRITKAKSWRFFNEAGFLEIAIFRSNPLKVGSANSLLGLNYRDVVAIEFKIKSEKQTIQPFDITKTEIEKCL